MKKYLCTFLILMLVSSSIAFADYNNMDNINIRENVKTFVERTSDREEFNIWKEKDISEGRELYNSKGELSAYLFTVQSDNNIIGYILVNPESQKVIEYALGQSPYDDYLSEYIKAKKR